jgi:hypothetical protein
MTILHCRRPYSRRLDPGLCWIKPADCQTGLKANRAKGIGMRKFGFSAMKAFLALSSVGKGGEQVDWLRVVALSSSIITVVVIVLYFLQRGH